MLHCHTDMDYSCACRKFSVQIMQDVTNFTTDMINIDTYIYESIYWGSLKSKAQP